MISPKMQKQINEQINAELYSSYLYLQMAAHFSSVSLKGFANWMTVQAQEEDAHAKKFFGFLLDRGGQVVLQAIDAPPNKWSSPLAVFEAVYKHECHVTARIHKLADLAAELKDHATMSMLQWFINEQVEEEANAEELVQRVKMIGDNSSALYLLDRELAARVFTPIATAAD